jgi:hypothetical protein
MHHATLAALSAAALLAGACTRGAGETEHRAVAHGLAGWVARKIADEKKAKREIEVMLETMHGAYRDGNIAEAAFWMDFPVQMVTDDWKGEVLSAAWDRETWMARMAPLFANPVHELQRTHRHEIFVVSDSLANVDDEQSVHMGKSTVTIRSSSLVVRKDGHWRVKSVVESGWGDSQLMRPGQAPREDVDAGRGAADAP